jgi:hypothetical protein
MFYSAPPAYWAAIEMNLAIVCACVPTLKPLIVHVIPSFSSRQSGGGNDSSQRSEVTKGSKIAHSFQRLDGGSLTTRDTDVEKGFESTELETVTALPAIHRKKTDWKGHIRITHELEQKSAPWVSHSSSQQVGLQGHGPRHDAQ